MIVWWKCGEKDFRNTFLSRNKRIPNYSICDGHLIVVQMVSKSVIARDLRFWKEWLWELLPIELRRRIIWYKLVTRMRTHLFPHSKPKRNGSMRRMEEMWGQSKQVHGFVWIISNKCVGEERNVWVSIRVPVASEGWMGENFLSVTEHSGWRPRRHNYCSK